MISYTVTYAYDEEKDFNFQYYCDVHLGKISKELFGDACVDMIVTKGMRRVAEGSKPAFVCVAEIIFTNIDDFWRVYTPARPALVEDLPKFTTIMPVSQIAEVVYWRSKQE